MHLHYNDVIMSTIASQITSLTIVYSTVYSGVDQRKHQSFASLAFVRGIHRGPVNSPHKGPVTRKMFPFHDVIMKPQQNERHYADHMFRYIFWGSNWQHISIGSGNGLALIGQQGITSINVDLVFWCHLALPAHNELTHSGLHEHSHALNRLFRRRS